MKGDSVALVFLLLVVMGLELESGQSNDIIFPEYEHHRLDILRVNQNRDCVRKHGVCVANVQGYPNSETIRRAMEPHKELLAALETRGSFHLASSPVSDDYNEACSSKEDVMYPQEGYDREGVAHLVVNDGPFYQPVTLHACRAIERPCNINAKHSKCVQQKRFLKLAVINSSEMIEIKNLRMPSHCSCYINFTSVGHRFGDSASAQQPRGDSQQTTHTRFPGTGVDADSVHQSQIQFVDSPAARRILQERWRRSQSGAEGSEPGTASSHSETSPSASFEFGTPTANKLVSPNTDGHLSLSVADQPAGFSSEIVVDSNVLRIRKQP